MIFVLGMVVLLILAGAFVVVPFLRRKRGMEATIAGVFVIGVAVGVYLLIGRPDLGLEPPPAMDETQPEDVITMVEHLAERLQAEPDDPEGWTMLGRAYVLMGRYQEAANAFGEAMRRTTGEDADLIASFAEARALADPASLDGEAGALFERVLELDPANPRGLWYGGLLAQARGNDAVALERWQQLLARDLPPEFRQVVEGRVASIDPSSIGAMVSVNVDVAPEFSGELPAGAVLFVFLRPAGEATQGPPLAARRVEFFDLPETLPLTHSDLLRGDSLPDGDYIVTARLSVDGEPARGPNDLEGSVKWNSAESSSVKVKLDTQRGE